MVTEERQQQLLIYVSSGRGETTDNKLFSPHQRVKCRKIEATNYAFSKKIIKKQVYTEVYYIKKEAYLVYFQPIIYAF